MSSSHITPKIWSLGFYIYHLLLRELTLIVALVTDSEEVLNQKDIEWSSKFMYGAEPSPSSNHSNLPAEKQKTRQRPRKTQVDSSVHKVLIVRLHLQGNEAGLISVKGFFLFVMTPFNCPLSNKELRLNQSELLYFTQNLICNELWSFRFLTSWQTPDSQFASLIYYAHSEMLRKISNKNFSVRRLLYVTNRKFRPKQTFPALFFYGMIRWNLFPVNLIPVFSALLNW